MSDLLAPPTTLVVASMRQWVAEEFAAAGRPGLEVLHSWGLDAPDLPADCRPAWWTPTEHAARLRHAGLDLPLLAPGPRWLADLPQFLTGRPVWAGRLADIAQAPRAGWAKPAEAKVNALPAQWWSDTDEFARAATAAGLPGDAMVQVSPLRLELSVEHRAFVIGGQVVATSAYLLPDGSTYSPGMEHRGDVHTDEAREFAASVAGALGEEQPPAYVLDVARTTAGRWVVLEANPVWASAAYGAKMSAVLDTVLRAVDYQDRHSRWAWQPDAWVLARATAQKRLPRNGTCRRL